MTELSATYRLQLREGMTFETATALADYLIALGISHLYLSPAFQAVPGSTHGYDITSFDHLDSTLGGDEAFGRLCAKLKDDGLGLILDFVPNHMATSPHNPWWRDTLEWGAASRYARHFDIDWAAGPLLLPILGQPYGVALADGVFRVTFDAGREAFFLQVYESELPLTPTSYPTLLAGLEEEPFPALARQFAVCEPEAADELKAALAEAAKDPKNCAAIEAACREASEDRERLHAVHEAQHFRLAYWRAGRERLTYRRFFEIADLAGIRVEDPGIFNDVHARLLSLIERDCIDGVRLDHIDGLALPKTYLERLQEAIGGDEPFYLLVEKILGPDELLPEDWPVAGTTGYEFITALAGLLVDGAAAEPMTQAYHAFLGQEVDYETLVKSTKRFILARNLAAELDRLTQDAAALAARNPMTRDWGPDTLRRAIIELATALPVYRTYVGFAGASAQDRAVIERAARAAKGTREVEDEAVIDFVARVLTLDFETPEEQAEALAVALRYQQTTGPVMAKALEDTVFYRFNRLIALNEVGGEPDQFGAPVDHFAEAMQARLAHQPLGLSATATHDTKRGEDARARLYAISEMPQRWAESVARWSAMNLPFAGGAEQASAVDRNTEWLFYQGLAGAWPLDLQVDDRDGLKDLAERMIQFMTKAVREAKALTSWTSPDEDYEAQIARFVTAVVNVENPTFLRDFSARCDPLFRAGAVNGLAQLAIKLTAPGVPDIYQGTEFWDFSLVDPDNRRPPDFAARATALRDIAAGSTPDPRDWRQGVPKMRLLRAGLSARQAQPSLFARGSFDLLPAAGAQANHVVAFARKDDRSACLTMVPRFTSALLPSTDSILVPEEAWGDTSVAIPEWARGRSLRDIITGVETKLSDTWQLSDALSSFPVCIGIVT